MDTMGRTTRMFRSVLAVFALVMTLPLVSGAEPSPAENIVNAPHWIKLVSQYREQPNPEGEICFFGDSITFQGKWREWIGNDAVTNRGIGGDTAWGLMARLDEVTEGKPSKIFLLIGVNDLSWGGKTPQEDAAQVAKLLDTIKRETPATTIYLQSVLPIFDGKVDKCSNAEIDEMNAELGKIAREKEVTWINLVPYFKDENGQLKESYTREGLHLTEEAYRKWLEVIGDYLR